MLNPMASSLVRPISLEEAWIGRAHFARPVAHFLLRFWHAVFPIFFDIFGSPLVPIWILWTILDGFWVPFWIHFGHHFGIISVSLFPASF